MTALTIFLAIANLVSVLVNVARGERLRRQLRAVTANKTQDHVALSAEDFFKALRGRIGPWGARS